MAINEILSSPVRLFSAVGKTWSEASLVTKTAAVAAPVFLGVGLVLSLRPRPVPPPKPPEEPLPPPPEVEEEEESSSEEVEFFDAQDFPDPKPLLKELPHDLRRGAMPVGEALKPLVGVLSNYLGLLKRPVVSHVSSRTLELFSSAEGSSEVNLLVQRDDWQIDPQWVSKLDARLSRSMKPQQYSQLQIVWNGIIGAWTKYDLFWARIPALRLLAGALVPVDKLSEKLARRMPDGDPAQVTEAMGKLINFAFVLFDALVEALYQQSDHEVFDLFWNDRAALVQEAKEGRSKRLTAKVKTLVGMLDRGEVGQSVRPAIEAFAAWLEILSQVDEEMFSSVLGDLVDQLAAE